MGNRHRLESRLRKARLYRARAITMRDLATQETDQVVKKAMLELAEDYDSHYHGLVGGTPSGAEARSQH